VSKWRNILLGLMLGFLGSAGLWLASSPPRGNPIPLQPAPTAAPIQVHVIGAVNLPGVYELPAGSRVLDAIQAAGGFTTDANDQALNLAALLEDGLQIRVLSLDSASDSDAVDSGFSEQSSAANIYLSHSQLININTATKEELESLPGIGSVTAEAIILHRNAEGPFTRIEDIQKVPGIGPAIFEDLKPLITVMDNP
jgi:competence protein ComEA